MLQTKSKAQSSVGFGATLEVEDAACFCERDELRRLIGLLDQHGVVRIGAKAAAPAAAIAAIANHLGEPPALDGARVKFVPGYEIISDLSAKAKFDDGRPRRAAAQELFHYDFAAGRHAAYSILHTREVPNNRPMRFVDMRAVYADLPDRLRARIAGLEHKSCGPLATVHPRTGAAILSLPPRQETRLEGLSEEDSAQLVQDLWSRVDASPARCEIEMRCNDVIIWDGLTAVHDNPVFPRAEDRAIWFLTIPLGEDVALSPAA